LLQLQPEFRRYVAQLVRQAGNVEPVAVRVVGNIRQQRRKVRHDGTGQAVTGPDGEIHIGVTQGDQAGLPCQDARRCLQHELQQFVQVELRREGAADL
jgi:hypothetical protein